MGANLVRQINPIKVVQCCTSFAVKWIFWSESMLCWAPQWWIRHSLSPWMIVWQKHCVQGVAESISRVSVCFKGNNAEPYIMEVVWCNQLVTHVELTHLLQGMTLYQRLSVDFCCWQTWHSTTSGLSQVSLGEWISVQNLPPRPLGSWALWVVTEEAIERGWLTSTGAVTVPYLEGQDCDIIWLLHREETSRCRASKPAMVNMGRIKYMFSLSRNIHR